MKIKKIFKRQIALQLIQQGHNMVYTEPNRERYGFSVFCFQETEELLKDLTQITQ